MTTYESEGMELITIEQLPVVAERFSQMVEPVRQRIGEILAMECNENTKSAVKAERTALRKFRDEMKQAVEAKKNELFAPWNAVEREVERIEKMCEDADVQLRGKITAVEDGEKHLKEENVREYFCEKCSALGIAWLRFEDTKITVRLSDSMKSLYRKVDEFTDRVASDVAAIVVMEDSAEILMEYKKHFVLGKAVGEVMERRSGAAREAELIKCFSDKAERDKTCVSEVSEIVREAKKLLPPVCTDDQEKPSVAIEDSSDKCYTMSFKVYGTLEELRGLKRYIVENGIQIVE